MQGQGGEGGEWAMGRGWDRRLTWASSVLAGAPEGGAAEQLGQHAVQQCVY